MRKSVHHRLKFVENRIRKHPVLSGVIVFIIGFILTGWLAAPLLFNEQQFARVVYDQNKQLLAAQISADGQWRFPPAQDIPVDYITAVVSYEDKRFFYHPGIDPIALVRAIITNFRSGKVVSGGSTITMQLARMLRGKPKRTVLSKLIECWYAIGLECRYSKKEILRWYASFAPYGGNVVGMDAALWRYFGRSERILSWAEASLLAVLPNQPSWLHLDRNRPQLLRKRNQLLANLYSQEKMDSTAYALAVDEPLPDQVHAIPTDGSILLAYLKSLHNEEAKFHTTIDQNLQMQVAQLAKVHARQLRGNEIHNMSILVVDNQESAVKVYIPNTPSIGVQVNNDQVDNIQSQRSSGSILKPLLYGAAWEKGLLHSKMLMPDIPTRYGSFSPQNHSRSYDGMVAAKDALQRSLNVPAVRLLQEYGLDQFYKRLIDLGFSSFRNDVAHYGLSIILGGGEISVWELTKVYSNLVNRYLQYLKEPDQRKWVDVKQFKLLVSDEIANSQSLAQQSFGPSAIFQMLSMMKGLPEGGTDWDRTSQLMAGRISWKTGTSFGYKDAWSIGISPRYTVAVWLGNSNGVGRPGLIGIHTAAPLMFEVAYLLGMQAEWEIPMDLMTRLEVCKASGYLKSAICPESDTVWMPKREVQLIQCPFHQEIYVDQAEKYRVHTACEDQLKKKTYFVFKPTVEYFYKQNHLNYVTIPDWRADCKAGVATDDQNLEIIYPLDGSYIWLPTDLDNEQNQLIFLATHRNEKESMYWFLDEWFLGTTKQPHEMKVKLKPGDHWLTVMDENGEKAKINFRSAQRSE